MVKFGTSGLRGLAVDLTHEVVFSHVDAFLRAVPSEGDVLIGQDLRASSPRITASVAAACVARGRTPIDCGVLPTPALALASQNRGLAAVMVTGSHIPADRNGLKFYSPAGEITKADEAAILGALSDMPAIRADGNTAGTREFRVSKRQQAEQLVRNRIVKDGLRERQVTLPVACECDHSADPRGGNIKMSSARPVKPRG